MASLFNPEDIAPIQEANAEAIQGHKLKHKFKLGSNKVKFTQLLPSLEKDTAYHMPSEGEWSTHQAIEHILTLTGPANVLLCTWAISEEAIKSLLKLIETGFIISLGCLLDERVKTYAPNAAQLVKKNISNIGLGKCHAKLCIIDNDNWHVSITGSSNLSCNRRIELYVITESKHINQQYIAWINKKIQEARPMK